MEIKDLMIGDLVYYSAPNHYVTEIKEIRCTHDFEPYLYFVVGARDNKDKQKTELDESFSIDLLHPIPITSEILKKIGFEEKEDDQDSTFNLYTFEKCDADEYYEILIRWRDSYDNGAYDAFNRVSWKESWEIYATDGSINIEIVRDTVYLNELQHIFSKLNINKKIDKNIVL